MNAVAQPLLEPEPDFELVARVAKGQLGALGELYDRHEQTIRRCVGRLGVAPGDADDILQSVFLEVVRSASRFDLESSARNWLLGIAIMLVRRQRRSMVRNAARLLNFAYFKHQETPALPEEQYQSDCAAARFEVAFHRLSPKRKEAFVLVTLEGMSGEQAANALGIPINTLWTRLHHARAELRRAVEGSRK
jgi:RNA polymerase sigma-70 factor (ECF subfamily)